ncbi:chemotaxis protein CheX [bacterium]|nr:chemotaxis protein CheX [bacterium]
MVELVQEDFESVNSQIFEDWGLMFVEHLENPSEEFPSDAPVYQSVIKFSGEHSGHYHIFCREDFMEALAQNVLGELDGCTPEEQRDALQEMANVVCGNLLTKLFGEDHVYELRPPEVTETNIVSLNTALEATHCAFMADDCPVVVSLQLEG